LNLEGVGGGRAVGRRGFGRVVLFMIDLMRQRSTLNVEAQSSGTTNMIVCAETV